MPERDAAQSPGNSAGFALVCRARERLCALPLRDLVETMRPMPVAPLAGAPSFVRGLALIRGTALPVVDVGALLGSAEVAQATRFVTLRVGARHVALALESVVGLRLLPSQSLSSLPPLLADASSASVSAVAALDSELLLVLQGARILPESFWLELEGPKA